MKVIIMQAIQTTTEGIAKTTLTDERIVSKANSLIPINLLSSLIYTFIVWFVLEWIFIIILAIFNIKNKKISKWTSFITGIVVLLFCLYRSNGVLEPLFNENWHVEIAEIKETKAYYDSDSGGGYLYSYAYVKEYPDIWINISSDDLKSLYSGTPVYIIVNNQTGEIYDCYTMEEYEYVGDKLVDK